MPEIGKTMSSVMEPPIQKIKELGQGRDGIVSFAQGLPWFGPPAGALERALERLGRGEGNGYSPDPGRDRLRELLAADLRRRGIAGAEAENILVTPGANQAIYIALACLADPGDEVILFRPYYFNNLMALGMLGLKPVLVDAGPEGGIDPASVRRSIGRRTRAMIVVSPNNPSGAVLARDNWEELTSLAGEKGLWILSDEAYRDFAWETPFFSPLAQGAENVLAICSFSKSFGMAGWRLGFMHAPRDVIAQSAKAADTLHICPGQPAQILAEEALAAEPDHPQRFRAEMRESRDLLIAALRPLERRGLVGELKSAGGFYLLVGLGTRRAPSGWDVARRLIGEHAIAAVPGEVFGTAVPSLRLSYGNIRPGLMAAAAPRLAAALTALLVP